VCSIADRRILQEGKSGLVRRVLARWGWKSEIKIGSVPEHECRSLNSSSDRCRSDRGAIADGLDGLGTVSRSVERVGVS